MNLLTVNVYRLSDHRLKGKGSVGQWVTEACGYNPIESVGKSNGTMGGRMSSPRVAPKCTAIALGTDFEQYCIA